MPLDAMPLDESAQKLIEWMRGQNGPVLGQASVEASRQWSSRMSAELQPQAPALARVEDGMLGSGPDAVACRRYWPDDAPDGPLPAVVFFHGGGFVLGTLDSHDTVCRLLCQASGCTVIAIDYRRAPEHKFPAAVADACHAAQWLHSHATRLGIDPNRMAVAGDSAGGNLAAVVCLERKEKGLSPFALQLLLYPVTDQHNVRDSHQRYGEGFILTRAALAFFAEQYFAQEQDRRDWRASPLLHEDLSGLPEALILTAGFDPLVDEGEAYALRLAQSGVRTTLRRFPGQVHGFVTRGRIIPEAFDAIGEMALLLRARFMQDLAPVRSR